ncbi:MAG TPA: hypothetical protein PLM53_12560 [Spirochaetota bacterium]|nr:hypothetical protein [Spirochaetota bacterium]HPC42084.1 hypothetical protein [Spirochaetota bacterium]HPL18489.1 hypothetical protein [Spirochaetota bacterium]HQF09038.1 hypothetical protein [Spirochaetota bacterium]HQH97926.1 hypothetical protein [Spirochaetota bacterium]
METTLNVHADILEKINWAARSRRVSRSEMIIVLIKRIMDDASNSVRFGRMVRYQERNRPDMWHTVHVKLRMDDYEYLLDLRRLLKMSVSLILAYAVRKHLNEIMKKKATDNNQYKNYVLIKEIFNATVCWKLIWGYPPDMGKLLP